MVNLSTAWPSGPINDTTYRDILFSLHPFIRSTVRDKILGVMFGSALGDAIGLYTEFLSKHTAQKEYTGSHFRFSLVEPVTPRKLDVHREMFKPASWTDDTDHALLIVLSYLRNDGLLLPGDIAKRLRVWCEKGLICLGTPPADIGITVQNVVFDKNFIEHPKHTAHTYWVQGGSKGAANGSLMRTHPLGIICVTMSLEQTFHAASELSLLTHPDPRCIVSCCICTALIRGMIRGEVTCEAHINAIIKRSFEWVQSWAECGAGRIYYSNQGGSSRSLPLLDRHVFDMHTQAESLGELQLDHSSEIGYVYKALGAAILLLRLAIRRTEAGNSAIETRLRLFEPLIQGLIMEGGDADTNACVAGALLGCWVGYTALPPHWRDGLRNKTWFLEKTEGVCQILGVSDYDSGYRGPEDPDTR